MAQLTLFEGSHLPRTAAREALARGDLDGAHAQLERLADATEEAVDAARLEQITSTLRATSGNPVEIVHEGFSSALARAEPRGFLSDAEWFDLYAQRVAGALDTEPGRRFRAWLEAHFAFAAGDREGARRAVMRIVESQPPGPAWIEAARVAFEIGEAALAAEWVHAACLGSPVELSAAPPALEPCGVSALDAAPPLPPLPAPVQDLFDAVRALEDLPGPRTRWVAVVGEIDRVLAPRSQGEGGPADAGAHDADPQDEDEARASSKERATRPLDGCGTGRPE
jgi:hypothetical protein